MKRIDITREHLVQDDDRDWAQRYRGLRDVVSPEERARALDKVIDSITDLNNVWVFGYGSLLWNPAMHYQERLVGTIYGLHRAFCLQSHIGRGSPDRPGLMLGLDRGGSCKGLAYRIAGTAVTTELDLLFKREMLTRIYRPTWVTVHSGSRRVPALTFVVDRDNERYAANLPESRQIEMIADASGQLGPCYEYLFDTVFHLGELGITDRGLCRLAAKVQNYIRDRNPVL